MSLEHRSTSPLSYLDLIGGHVDDQPCGRPCAQARALSLPCSTFERHHLLSVSPSSTSSSAGRISVSIRSAPLLDVLANSLGLRYALPWTLGDEKWQGSQAPQRFCFVFNFLAGVVRLLRVGRPSLLMLADVMSQFGLRHCLRCPAWH